MPINKKYLFSCILLSLMLCFAQISASTPAILGCLTAYLLLLGWACIHNSTLLVLLYFLPWATLLKLSPGSYSFYTFGLVLTCGISVIRGNLRLKKYALIAGIAILFLTLLSKLLDGRWLELSYIAFLMMLVLLPTVKQECQRSNYEFYHLTVFLSLGIILAALCAMTYADSPNIARYIQVDTYNIVVRRSGFYGDANFYTAQITAALGGCMLLLLREKQRGRILLLMGLIFLLIYYGAMSASKSFVLVTACILPVWIWNLLRLRNKPWMKVFLLAALVLLFAVLSTSELFAEMIDIFTFRFSKTKDLNSFTTNRISLWDAYIRELLEDSKVFFLGRGFSDVKINGRASHNTILQMFHQFGFLGAPFLIYWVSCLLRDVPAEWKKQDQQGHSFLIVVLGIYLPWLAIDSLFFDDFFLLQWYAFMALYQISSPQKKPDAQLVSPAVSAFEGQPHPVTASHKKQNRAFGEVELQKLIALLLKNVWSVSAVSLVSAVLTLFTTILFVTPQYRASVMFYVNNNTISAGSSVLGISKSDLQTSRYLVESYAVILNTRETLSDALEYAGSDRSYDEFQDMISTEVVNETEIFRVSVESPDPDEAEQLANAIAHVLPGRIGSIVEKTSSKVVETAVIPSGPVSPSYRNNTLLGFLLGFTLSAGLIVIRDLYDVTVRSEEDIAETCTYPILTSVPDLMLTDKHRRNDAYGRKNTRNSIDRPSSRSDSDPSSADAALSFAASEAYKLLRTKLQFSFADDRACRVVGISSALSGEGKSLTSVNLAYTLSQTDKKVLLVDCDMRRPTLAEKLNLPKRPGLSGVLTGQSQLAEVISPCGMQDAGQTFHVITAGQNPPNPMELLNSSKMRSLLKELREEYDYVLLDLPPVGEVSDAMVITAGTDGLLIVVRQNHCSRIALSDMVRQFGFIHAKILGIVFNCVADQKSGHGRYLLSRNHSGHYRK